jgi:hypothetical protein
MQNDYQIVSEFDSHFLLVHSNFKCISTKNCHTKKKGLDVEYEGLLDIYVKINVKIAKFCT